MDSPSSFLTPNGRLAARISGWESRPQQIVMADLVAAAIDQKKHAVIEGWDWNWQKPCLSHTRCAGRYG